MKAMGYAQQVIESISFNTSNGVLSWIGKKSGETSGSGSFNIKDVKVNNAGYADGAGNSDKLGNFAADTYAKKSDLFYIHRIHMLFRNSTSSLSKMYICITFNLFLKSKTPVTLSTLLQSINENTLMYSEDSNNFERNTIPVTGLFLNNYTSASQKTYLPTSIGVFKNSNNDSMVMLYYINEDSEYSQRQLGTIMESYPDQIHISDYIIS